MKFLCSGCGACCNHVGTLQKELPVDENGRCLNLDENNQCKIYDTRPDVCRVNKMFEKNKGVVEGRVLTRLQYYMLNTLTCHRLIDMDGLDEKFKIPLGDYDKEK
jgi:Fe-S-cluster containining protein|tara:strand:+ start:368 stop:682 length:315 start_codon:yes stop_codon:yes gene_type:complete